MAKALAHALGDEATYRQLLKTEALKQFDGDYDVLYRAFAAQQPGFGRRMDELVAGSSGSQPLTGMAEVLTHVPNLNISVPVHIDKWNTGSLSPLVLFIPADYDEKTYTKPLQAYDKDGQVHLLDNKKAPDYPVVVVGPSERVKGTALTSENFGPKGANAQKGGATTNRVPSDDGGGVGGPPYVPPTPPSTPPQYYATCRTDNQTEYLRSLWMKGVSYYESWFLGDPEVVLQILTPTGLTSSSGGNGTLYQSMYVMPRLHIEDTWYCDLNLYYWSKSRYGDAVKYVWLEQDGGTIATVETTIKGVKVTYVIANDDDMIGTQVMDFDYCPSNGHYTLGGGSSEFQWTMQNRP